MKAVMLSIQPKWCEKISSGKKTVEVRKTRPNIVTPFKCYIYQTKGIVPMLGKSNEHWKTLLLGVGKVIGEFVCDKIIFAECGSYAKLSLKDTQLDADDLMDYADGKPVFGWHISDLVIYDTPKEIGEFKQCHKCEYYENCIEHELSCDGTYNLKRPPQSWCYVEVTK